MSKKPFHARVTASASVANGAFTINARITDAPDFHIGRPIVITIDGTRSARQLGESLIAWADAKEKWYRDGDGGA